MCGWSSITEFYTIAVYKPIKEDTACAYIQRGIGIIQNVRKKTLITEVGVNTNIKHKYDKKDSVSDLVTRLSKNSKNDRGKCFVITFLFIAISLEHN